jgi:hypothetical protein
VAKEVTDLSQRQEQKTKNPAFTKINAYTPLKSE